MFTEADFELFTPRFQADPEWNGRRLDVRHRLQALGDDLVAACAKEGVGLERRESLHHPHTSNGKKVRRQRTMLFRDKKSRKKLQSFLGKELGKDLDSARNNLHFQVVIDGQGCRWGLRNDANAWYDLNVLVKRAEEGDGQKQIAEACAAGADFQFVLDGRGGSELSTMQPQQWRDFSGMIRPGESSYEIVAEMPKEAIIQAGLDWREGVMADLLRLLPFYRLATWSSDSPSGVSW